MNKYMEQLLSLTDKFERDISNLSESVENDPSSDEILDDFCIARNERICQMIGNLAWYLNGNERLVRTGWIIGIIEQILDR